MKIPIALIFLLPAIVGGFTSCTGTNNYGQAVISDVQANAGSVVTPSGFAASAGPISNAGTVRAAQSGQFWGGGGSAR